MKTKPKNWVDYKEVKASVSIEQVLDHYDLAKGLKQQGNSLRGVCPFHGSGKNENQFHVSLVKNAFNCFGCDAKGNILDFVALMEGVNIREAALKIQDWFLIKREPVKLVGELAKEKKEVVAVEKQEKDVVVPSEQVINSPLTFTLKLKPDHAYLKQRGIVSETIKKFGLGYCSRGILKNRIAIPVHNEKSELVAYVGRAIDAEGEAEGKYKFPAGFQKSSVLYNLNQASEYVQQQGLVLVEGFFDVFNLAQAGYQNVCALMGSKMSEYQERLITDTTDKVILMFDADDAGKDCVDDVLNRLVSKIYVRIAQLPPDKMQPDQLTPDDIKEILG